MQISVFGLGYVGAVSAGCLAASGHTVIGVDINPQKVDCINGGQAPIIEPEIDALIEEGVRKGRLSATTDAGHAVLNSDVSLVCVGTPSLPNGNLDSSHVESACAEIGGALRRKVTPHLVVIRSTLLPGTTDALLIPRLETTSGRRHGPELGVCYNPEFLREGSSVKDFYNPPKIVIGQDDAANGRTVAEMYTGLEAPVVRTSIRTAEMVKYVDNAFHALKVSFANEIGNICKQASVDSHEVMSIFCMDRKLNLSPAYLKPGFAFGGSCLPKDLRALTYQARRFDLESPVLGAILASNGHQIRLGVERAIGFGKKRIGFVGMSFKPASDDLRESPLVAMIETLLGKGYAVRVFDPYVSMNRLVGANRKYVAEHLPHLSSLLVDSLEELMAASEVLVLGHASEHARAATLAARPEQIVLDLVGGARDLRTAGRYVGMSW
ncbi:MAG: GDP-mannose dehydrogenase [Candidatus Rokuibacteriota bacterium]|nr:MAG: GDP-mannose dehydrogenase [Candidatus Rokubacteria bacterium]